MSEKHDRGTFEQGVKKEQKEGLSEYALCLYSDFALPELGESKPLGRVLDEEIYVSLNYDSNYKGPDRRPSYWIGNNESAGWQEMNDPDPKIIWDKFEEIAKQKLWLEALNRRGGDEATNYWYQKFVNRREPALRANIDETVLLVVITEQGENRNQCEEQRNIFDFSHGFACR